MFLGLQIGGPPPNAMPKPDSGVVPANIPWPPPLAIYLEAHGNRAGCWVPEISPWEPKSQMPVPPSWPENGFCLAPTSESKSLWVCVLYKARSCALALTAREVGKESFWFQSCGGRTYNVGNSLNVERVLKGCQGARNSVKCPLLSEVAWLQGTEVHSSMQMV